MSDEHSSAGEGRTVDRPEPALIADDVLPLWDARPVEEQLREACQAVLHGRIWDGFNGPDGVSKDDALFYAAKLAEWVERQIDGCEGSAK